MAPSYSWHPGAFRLASRWAVPTSLFPDEILSSWLLRAALANGCDPLAFMGAIWPMQRVWTMDLDRHPKAGLIDKLSDLSGATAASLKHATLHPIAQLVLSTAPPSKQSWPWILSVGSRNRRRIGRAQYCPRCLATDESPFFRLQWRFAWHSVCTRHDCQLLEACPHCSAALEPHRILVTGNGLDYCMECDLSLSREVPSQTPLPGAQRLQLATDEVLRAKQTVYLGKEISVANWFTVVKFYIDLVRRALRAQTISLEAFAPDLTVTFRNDLGFVPLEKLALRQRAHLLDCAGRFMLLPFEQLVSEFSAAGLSRQAAFPSGMPDVPPLRTLAEALPDQGIRRPVTQRNPLRASHFRPRSQREVERMMRVLRRRTSADTDS